MMVNNEAMPYSVVQATFEQIEQELGAGMVPRIFLLLEKNPDLLVHIWGQFRTLVLQGNLPRTLKEMVGLVVAITTHCDYVQVVHMHSLTLQGVAREALDALREGNYTSSQLNSLSQNVLRFAAMTVATRSAYPVPSIALASNNSDWATLRQQTNQLLTDLPLSEAEKVELIATLGLFEQICTVANLLELDPAQP
jgi:AhpD family alkylhydroperoxidase